MNRKSTGIMLSLILLLVVALSGCGSNSASTGSNGQVTLNFWFQQTGPYQKALQKLVDKFNSTHKNIQVKATFVGTQDAAPQKLLASIAAGTSPDVTELDSLLVPQFASKGALLDLSKYVTDNSLKSSNFIPSLWEANTFKNKLYALPHDTDVRFLYWNKDKFQAAGLNPNTPPKTLDELDQFATKLTKIDNKGNIVQGGFIPYQNLKWFYTWGWAFGANYQGANGKINIYTPESVKAFKWEQSYAEKYGAVKINSFINSVPQNVDPFVTNKLAIEINGVWNIATIKDQNPKLNYGVAPIPTVDGKGETWSGGMSYAIPKGSKHADEAFEFIKWLDQEPQMLQWDQDTTHYPVLLSLLQKVGTSSETIVNPEVDRLAAQLLPSTHTRPTTPVGGELYDSLAKLTSKVTTDLSSNPKELLRSLDTKINQDNQAALQ